MIAGVRDSPLEVFVTDGARRAARFPAMHTLSDLGADANLLTPAERTSLDERGFCFLHDCADAIWLEAVRQRYEELVRLEGSDLIARADYNTEFHREVGARRLPDLVNKGVMFDRAWQHPRILAAVAHVLKRPFRLSALSGRDALRNHGHQALHADWGVRAADEPFHVVNCIWVLDGFTTTNGGTRVVPGTHRESRAPGEVLADLEAPHPDQLIACCPPGTVLVNNSHTWHGGTSNTDGTPRRTLHSYFAALGHSQQLDQAEYLRERTAARLTRAKRLLLLGVCRR